MTEKQLRSSSQSKSLLCSEMKLLLTSLFLICTLATVVQLLPTFHSITSPCLPSSPSSFSSFSSSTSPPPPPPPSTDGHLIKPTILAVADHNRESSVPLLSSTSPLTKTKRVFPGFGSAAYLFVLMGAYRAGPNSFAVVGLSSKPLHVYGNPAFSCVWTAHQQPRRPITAAAVKILPDWGFGRIYTVLVLNCTFNATRVDSGGRLVVRAGADDRLSEEFEVLVEPPGNADADDVSLLLSSPPKYEVLYCGSPLYGNLSPERVREWLAYHVRLFGTKSHFIIYDAGGVHAGVAEVLAPWMEKGYVTVHDVRDQERFDGYYHNQFLVVNDCLHRYRFQAKWMFFFDVDEFIHVSPRTTLPSFLANMTGYSQFLIEQRPMSSRLCLSRDVGKTPRMWGLEKLVYRDVKPGIRRDRKYAIQPRQAFATGVHMSQDIVGRRYPKVDGWIRYFHYHGTINERRDPCKVFVDGANLTADGRPYVLDTTLRLQANLIKKFELEMIGKKLQRTRQ